MFDLLKKKIGSFISGLTKKEGETPQEPKQEIKKPVEIPEQITNPLQKTVTTPPHEKIEEPKRIVQKETEKPKEEPVTLPKSIPTAEKPVTKPKETIHPQKEVVKPQAKVSQEPVKTVITKPGVQEVKSTTQNIKPVSKPIVLQTKPTPKPAVQETRPATQDSKPKETMRISDEIPAKDIEIAQEKGEKKVKQGIGSAITSFITGVVEIREQDVKELLDTLELELLESDVSLEVADTIIKRLKTGLVGKKVKRGNIETEIKEEIQNTLVSIMESDTSTVFSLFEKTPLTIMVCGINGAGKTTTMAKLAHRFISQGKKVCFAASDTFRAAAIEQLDVHAKRLNVPIIKRPYGADPTAVAFDAVQYAKAHGINVILIDTAGRQDTNTNLMNELKKMERVIKPDLKVYVGESLAGNAIMDQVRTFKEEIGLDGVILTKIDCDPKGGTVLSIKEATGVPILFVGTGQKYEDLHPFNAREMVNRILE